MIRRNPNDPPRRRDVAADLAATYLLPAAIAAGTIIAIILKIRTW